MRKKLLLLKNNILTYIPAVWKTIFLNFTILLNIQIAITLLDDLTIIC